MCLRSIHGNQERLELNAVTQVHVFPAANFLLAVNRITINNTTEIPVLAIEENGLEVNM
jgi:hypothetical protein